MIKWDTKNVEIIPKKAEKGQQRNLKNPEGTNRKEIKNDRSIHKGMVADSGFDIYSLCYLAFLRLSYLCKNVVVISVTEGQGSIE